MISSSGIGTYLKSLVAALASENRFTLILLGHQKDAAYLDSYGEVRIVKSPIYSFQEQIELPLKIPSCDLFWSPHFNIPLLPIRAKKRITTIHDVYHLAFSIHLSWLKKIYAHLFYNAAVYHADRLITVSHFTAAEMKRYLWIQPKNLVVIPNGVPERGGMIKRGHFILAVSSVKLHKNISLLKRAAAELNVELIIVGKGFRQVSEEELHALYKQAALLVFPSLYEGFGYPPLEAMSFGCPVVASDIGSVREVCGSAVEYINPLKINSLKRGIKRIFYDEKRREELVEKGFLQVKKFLLSDSLKRHIQVIDKIIDESSNNP